MHKLTILVAAAAAFAGSAATAQPIAEGGEGLIVTASTIDNIIATYEGTTASFTSLLYLVTADPNDDDLFLFNNQTSPVGSTVDLGAFAIGTELLFRLDVTNTGESFFTGPGSRNPDGQAHARVQGEWEPGTTLVSFEDLLNGPFEFNDLSFSFTNTTATPPVVPEPASWAMMIAGFGLVGGALRRKAATRAIA